MKKRIQLLLGATLIVFMGLGQAFGQSFKTITVDGSLTDWTYTDDGDFARGGQNTNWYFAWDDTYFYFAVERVNGSIFGDGDAATIFLDINGGLSTSSGIGTTTGSEYQGVTATLPVKVDFAIRLERNYKQMNRWDDGSSAWSSNLSTTNFSDSNNGDTRTIREARIPWSEINGNGSKPHSVSIISYLSYNTGVFGSFPEGNETQNGNGSSKTFSNYVGYLPLNESVKSNSLRDSLNQYLIVDGSAGFRLMSSPVTTSYSDILDEIWTQGASSGADATNGDPNVFGWKWNVLSPEWETLTNLSANISTGVGFLVYVFADDDYDGSADAFPKTLSVSGTEHSGNVEPNINTDNDVYQLFGNPYASTIDFDDITKTNLTNVAYVWDPNAGGSGEWETWNGTTGDLTDGLIAPFQGFFIQTASSGTPDITITEASKSSNGSFLGKAVEEPQKIRFEVEGNGLSNSAFLQFGINGSPTEKVIGDAEELTSLSSSFAQLSFAKADGLFDIANIGNPTEEVTIPLDFTSSTGGVFTLSATDFDVSSNYDLSFHDYKTGESLLIDESFRYSFETQRLKPQEVPVLTSLTAWAIKAKSSESNRFGITLTPSTSVSIDDEIDAPTEFTLGQNYPNPFNPTTNINYSVGEAGPVNITVYNTMGQKVAELLNTTKNAGSYQITWNATGVASGIYYYRLTAPGQVLTRQMTLIK
jgi:hypothetical protein